MKTPTKITAMMAMLLSVFLFSGCFEKDDPSPSYCSQLDHEANETARLAARFEQSPTQSNCNALRRDQISLLNKMLQCPDYGKTETQNLLSFWNNYDCSIFDGSGGGGGGTGGGNNNPSNGTATFWTQSDLGCGNITVTVNGQSRTISSYYSGGAPSCSASGTASFTLSAGTYNFTASCSQYNWNGTVTITNGNCSFMRLHK